MFSLVPEVHLFICLDARVAPGPVLQCLDVARAQEWQQETVLICDESWREYVNIDQPVLFINRDKVFSSQEEPLSDKIPHLDAFLEQLDHFEVKKITQVGELNWGRWLSIYFESDADIPVQSIEWEQAEISSLQVVNDIGHELALDMGAPLGDVKKTSAVYVDPYVNGEMSPVFVKLFEQLKADQVPAWMSIVYHEKDFNTLRSWGLEDCLIDFSECSMSLFNQPVLCFSDRSPFAQTSRSYNVAIYGADPSQSLFLPGDISIRPSDDLHISELQNILSYWRGNRLKELAFQWLSMGIEIECVENFHGRLVQRNLQNYSTDLAHCQILIDQFLRSKSKVDQRAIYFMIYDMRKNVNNDPFALSFSLKILLMIIERMISSAKSGERLFARLGSDYHRIVIGEALIEGLIDQMWDDNKIIKIKKQLESFYRFLIKTDFTNDQMESLPRVKESA